MDLNTLLTISKITGAAAGGGGVIVAAIKHIASGSRQEADIAGIKEDVHTILTNHLPHVEEKIDKLNERLTDHIVESAKSHNA